VQGIYLFYARFLTKMICLFVFLFVCVCVFCREMGDAYYVINRFDCFLDFDRSISFSAFGILVDFLSLSLSLV